MNTIVIEPVIGVEVSVKAGICPKLDCYWPRACEDSFIPKRGVYNKHWVCNEQMTIGCPENPTLQQSGTIDNMEEDPNKKKAKTVQKKAVKKIIKPSKEEKKKVFKIIRK